ncbi:MAG: hypothetical protein AAF355_13905 [Myxococcota bacterium]
MSKFADFLSNHKIDRRRLLATSRRIEKLRPEDRIVRMARTKVRRGSDQEELKTVASKQARSGKPVTPLLLNAAILGQPVSSKAKKRILRALNAILEQKGGESASSELLF